MIGAARGGMGKDPGLPERGGAGLGSGGQAELVRTLRKRAL